MTTLERLQNLLVQQYGVDPEAVAPDVALETLEIDSLGLMELLFTIEDEFGLEVPQEKQSLQTVADVVAFIDHLLVEQKSGTSQSRTTVMASANATHDTGPGAPGAGGVTAPAGDHAVNDAS